MLWMFFFLFCKKKPLIKGFDTKNLPMPYYPEYCVRFFKKRFLGIHLFGEYGNPEWENSKLYVVYILNYPAHTTIGSYDITW